MVPGVVQTQRLSTFDDAGAVRQTALVSALDAERHAHNVTKNTLLAEQQHFAAEIARLEALTGGMDLPTRDKDFICKSHVYCILPSEN